MAKSTATATKSTRAPRAKKIAAAVAPESTLLHADTLGLTAAEYDPLDALLNELGAPDEVIESGHQPDTVMETVIEADADDELPVNLTAEEIEAAAHGAEAADAMIASAQPISVSLDSVPTGDASDAPSSAPDIAPLAVKKAPVPRKHYTDKVERLKDRMGAGLNEYTVLTVADADIDEEALRHRMEETIAIIKAMNTKQQQRAGYLIEYMAGKKATLNAVLKRILTVLHKDGFISTGAEGNVLKDLLTTYTPGAARAMGGNTIGVFEDLKLILKDGKGRFVPNPESLLLMKVNSMLFTAPVAATSEPEGEPAETEAAAEEEVTA